MQVVYSWKIQEWSWTISLQLSWWN